MTIRFLAAIKYKVPAVGGVGLLRFALTGGKKVGCCRFSRSSKAKDSQQFRQRLLLAGEAEEGAPCPGLRCVQRTMVLDKEEGVPMLSVQPKGKQKGCAGCNRKIKDRYLLKALDKYWHEDCLKCACCDCRLGEVGSTLYTKANLILCRRDYLRLFGTTGNCAACSKLIPAFEMVMRARENVYHLDCFACQLCNQRFCVGDKFFLKNNMILCQMDYEEGAMNGSFSSQVQ
ncbi:rhombotin-1 isoform X1 [Chiloscyllium punctatum]|uniref:LIM zinc-binding domain-containing protein n=3 Tax=Galeoidea TaxID=119195 RepID=A0A401S5K0_CHIPU|nr:hypothetical protein [Chiloscyllium punctatum]